MPFNLYILQTAGRFDLITKNFSENGDMDLSHLLEIDNDQVPLAVFVCDKFDLVG
jgi:hypothetical protein